MKKILIVDDSSTARMVIRRCLEIVGMRDSTFTEAENGRQAMEILRKEPFDLVITDINMPVMDGCRLLREVKTSPRLNSIPVIVVTSLGNPALEEELKRIGAEKVMYKPVSPDKFNAAIAEILEKAN